MDALEPHVGSMWVPRDSVLQVGLFVRISPYAAVCSRMQPYAAVCNRMRPYSPLHHPCASVHPFIIRMLAVQSSVCSRTPSLILRASLYHPYVSRATIRM
jgi:hypothetical protein